jgi:hypothetical protein
MKTSKKRCWACNNINGIKWSKQQEKQRFKCKSCGILFTSTNQSVKLANQEPWFYSWIIGRHTIPQIMKHRKAFILQKSISFFSINTKNKKIKL